MPSFDIKTAEARALLQRREKPYWDISVPNRHIGIRVRDTQTWVLRCRTKQGNYLEQTVGPAEPFENGLPYREVRLKAEAWFAECDARQYTQPFNQNRYGGQLSISPIGDVYTVGHALAAYVEWKRLVASPSHFKTNLVLVNYHIVPRLAHIPLAAFTAHDLNAFCVDVLRTPPKRGHRPCGPKRSIESLSAEELRKRKKTINALIGILRLAFELAYDNGHIDTDRPRRCLRLLPNYDRPRLLILDRAQCGRLLDAANDSLKALILGALYSGCRITELRELRVIDVADQCHGIHVRRAKNYQSRHVILPDEGVAFFLKQCRGKAPDDRVFLNRRGRPWGDHYKTLFKQAVIAAQLDPELVFHSLRHTYASHLLQNGATLSMLARQLGHANVNTVHTIYGHLTSSSTLRELDRCFDGFGTATRSELTQTRRSMRALRKAATNTPAESGDAWPRSNHSRHSGPLADLGKPTR